MGTQLYAPENALMRLLRRFNQNISLSVDELPVVRQLGWEIRAVRRRQTIDTVGIKHRLAYFVIDGFLMRYRTVRDGRRQIVNLAIPGDFVGNPSCYNAIHSIKALTNATIAAVPLARLAGLYETEPRLAAKIFWSFSSDAAMQAEHLAVVGQRPALERIAHFLLELHVRLQMVGEADEYSFRFPFSQKVIGDALGLSLAYVNRSLRRLADENLVKIEGQSVVFGDLEQLSALADFDRSYLRPLPIVEVARESSIEALAEWDGKGLAGVRVNDLPSSSSRHWF
jgi:CRP-like cAMP-binding protein